ncbi:MAG: helix-turn-helix domain-containing protein [Leptospiraceae bacterium]
MHDLISEALWFGTLFSGVLVFYYLLSPRPSVATRMLALLYLSAAFCLFFAYWNFQQRYFHLTLLNHLYLPFVYFIGPCIFFSFLDALNENFKIRPIRYLAFAPGLLILLILPFVWLLSPEQFAYPQLSFFQGRQWSWIDILNVAGLYSAVLYCIFIAASVPELFSIDTLRKEKAARTLVLILICSTVLTFIAASGLTMRSELVYFAVSVAGSLFLPVNFILKARTPELFADLELVLEEARFQPEGELYKVSRLEGVDLKELQKSLDWLMRDQKVFTSEDLTLKILAGMVNVKSYQLTEFLNTKLKMNFARYVNHFRVEEAIRILREEPEANVLSVAFQVGFNSKANFNLAFKAIKGLSPRKYLERPGQS